MFQFVYLFFLQLVDLGKFIEGFVDLLLFKKSNYWKYYIGSYNVSETLYL